MVLCLQNNFLIADKVIKSSKFKANLAGNVSIKLITHHHSTQSLRSYFIFLNRLFYISKVDHIIFLNHHYHTRIIAPEDSSKFPLEFTSPKLVCPLRMYETWAASIAFTKFGLPLMSKNINFIVLLSSFSNRTINIRITQKNFIV